MDNRFYWYWLGNIPRLGNKKVQALLNVFGEPEAIYKASEKLIRAANVLMPNDYAYFNESKKNSKIYDDYLKLYKNNIRMLTINDADYPGRLKNIYDRPVCIYLKGRPPAEKLPAVAIVGARACSEYGRLAAEHLSAQVAAAGVNVISGMAKGIDGAAHRGALKVSGYTLAVLAGGVDLCYPRENIELYMEIADKGGIISEYAPGTEHLPSHFPLRNRIISAMADIIIVVEARQKSGSLITVDMALEQNKTVMAVPGRITDRLSWGCNNLIRQGAGVVCDAEDILEAIRQENISNPFYGVSYIHSSDADTLQDNEGNLHADNTFSTNVLTGTEKMLYACLDLMPKNINQLMEESGLDIGKVSQALVSLELRGCIKECGCGFYIRLSP